MEEQLLDETSFDVIVVGTGIAESMLSSYVPAALSPQRLHRHAIMEPLENWKLFVVSLQCSLHVVPGLQSTLLTMPLAHSPAKGRQCCT